MAAAYLLLCSRCWAFGVQPRGVVDREAILQAKQTLTRQAVASRRTRPAFQSVSGKSHLAAVCLAAKL